MPATHSQDELRVAIIEFIASKGTKVNIYQIITNEFDVSPTQIRLTLKKMEQEELVNIFYSHNTSSDIFGFRLISEIRLQL